jgi:multidrug resistance efflux pump
MDGELVAASPSLKLSFPGNVAGELLALQVRVGQRVEAGDLIAALDDDELQATVQEAQLDLDRAVEDMQKAESDAQEDYERQVQEADKRYRDELREAERALESAQDALQRAKMQPPTTALAEAKSNLATALDEEAQAYDEYKQALDRPWEPQRIRDALYKDWQRRIAERDLAELRLKDAQVSLEAYYFDLEIKAKDVERAEADLAGVEMDLVEREETLSYARAVDDAQRKLDDALRAVKDARLYAPWDGLVISIDANVGSEVTSGTAIVTMINLEQLYFVTDNLSERHVAQLAPGQRANITLRAYPDTVLHGQVDTVIPRSERTADAEAPFVAYIQLDETALNLLPGMTGRVEVITEEE